MAAYVDMAVIALAWAFLVSGALLCVIGGIGLLRFPDFYTRMHPAGMIDTGGVLFIIVGLMLRTDDWLILVKLLLILFLLFFTSPTATHAVAKAAVAGRIEPWKPGDGLKREG
jgi:multicomponent Na+:H+ antiporter subunit G